MRNESRNKIVRTHDYFYAEVDLNAPPKDSFIQLKNLIAEYKSGILGKISIVDFGCASGTFVNYLSSQFPNDKVRGIEFLELLVNAGKQFYPNIDIAQGSILDKHILPKECVDIITVIGVISIFDDIEPIIQNLAYWVKPGGRVFIHGMFNPAPVDVFVKYRLSENYEKEEFESGWNIISQETISRLLHSVGANKIQFHEFNLSIELERDLKDPLRSWTEKMENGSTVIVNGTCLKQPQFILEAQF
jgi:SAM-dependent methyltransferase